MYRPQLPVLVLIYMVFFFNPSVLSFADNFPTPHPPTDKNANDELGRLGIHLLMTLLTIIVYKLRGIHEAKLREKYKSSEQSCRRFSLADVLSATKNFDISLAVGEGGFGMVYKGVIDDGTITVAIKRLDPKSKQGAAEFRSEIEKLSRIRHCNIVSLIGYCQEGDEMILIYDYMVNGTLGENIYRKSAKSHLLWAQRLRICIGAAHGLNYLHTGTGDRDIIIHRDVKSSNILLAENWTAKVSDFGISKIGPRNQQHSHVSTNIKGTCGYKDPEYELSGQLTEKSDVYSFGVVLLEVLCGRRALDSTLNVEERVLVNWAQQCMKKGNVDQIIDPSLKGQIYPDSLTEFAQIAERCLHSYRQRRPTMAEVVVALENALRMEEKTDFSIRGGEFVNMGSDHDNQDNSQSSNMGANEDSCVMPARTMTSTKMAQQLDFGMSCVISGNIERKGVRRMEIEEDIMKSISILPASCISEILALTSPRDACRSSAISRGFKTMADSDALWERFLPSDYKELLEQSDSAVVYSTKKQLYFLLSDTPILVEGGKLVYRGGKA